MPKGLQVHPAERVDLGDFTRGVRTFTQDSVAQVLSTAVLDNQARYLRGFRVEIPDQTNYPGRIVVHGGDAYDPSGQKLLNEDQVTVSRTVTLEGVSTNFYVEIEFIEGDSDVDARAFWDPTVDQGADVSGDALPDGQEFSDIIATRKSPDWKVVTPVSTTAFERTNDPTSTKIPLILLGTDGANQINATGNTSFSTEKFAATLLEVLSPTLIRVQDAQLFLVGNDVNVGQGLGTVETFNISNVDYVANLITLSGSLTLSHTPGEICRAASAATTAVDIVQESTVGRYRRDAAAAAPPAHEIDVRDKLFQGDEIHGKILSAGHSSPTARSDVNLQALKDYVDFLSAQIEEMKWGYADPYESKTSTNRLTPGLSGAIPGTPRYFDRSQGGIGGARVATVTVGDGVNSWGDLNGTTDAVLTAAYAALPADGGLIFLKTGTWTLGANVTLGSKNVIICGQGPRTSVRVTTANRFVLTGTSAVRVQFRDIRFRGTAIDAQGIRITGGAPDLSVENCVFEDAIVSVNSAMLDTHTFRGCVFKSNTYTMTKAFVHSEAAAATVSGMFNTCLFSHPNAAASSSLSDTDTNGSGFVKCSFVDCKFDSSGAGGPTFKVGTGTDGLFFDRCSFVSSGSSDSHFIRLDNGGRRVSITNSLSFDANNGLIYTNNFAREILIQNFQTQTLINDLTPLSFNNTSKVKILDSRIVMSSTNAILTDSCVRITNNDAGGNGSEDYLIEGNEFREFSTSVVTSVFIRGNGGLPLFYNLILKSNYINTCAVGVYFAGVVATTIQGLSIEGNYFTGTKKNGVLLGDTTNTTLNLVNICDNSFNSVTDGTSVEVGVGTGRSAISLVSSGGNVSNYVIDGNSIRNIGDSGVSAWGVRVSGSTHGSITDNSITDVAADNVSGVFLATSDNITISGNSFDIVQGTAALSKIALGIRLDGDLFNCIVSNNTGKRMNQALDATNLCAFIGTGISATYLTGVVFDGNSYRNPTGLQNQNMFHFECDTLDNVKFNSNSCVGDVSILIGAIFVDTTSVLRDICINGNNFSRIKESVVWLSGQATDNQRINISDNNLEMVDVSAIAALNLNQLDMVVINGNTVRTLDIASDGVGIVNVDQFIFTDNMLRQVDAGTGDGIVVTIANQYVISNNIFDGTKAGGSFSINTGLSAGGGIVVENMHNGALSVAGGDDTSGTGNTSF
jgi:hypothetical protein